MNFMEISKGKGIKNPILKDNLLEPLKNQKVQKEEDYPLETALKKSKRMLNLKNISFVIHPDLYDQYKDFITLRNGIVSKKLEDFHIRSPIVHVICTKENFMDIYPKVREISIERLYDSYHSISNTLISHDIYNRYFKKDSDDDFTQYHSSDNETEEDKKENIEIIDSDNIDSNNSEEENLELVETLLQDEKQVSQDENEETQSKTEESETNQAKLSDNESRNEKENNIESNHENENSDEIEEDEEDEEEENVNEKVDKMEDMMLLFFQYGNRINMYSPEVLTDSILDFKNVKEQKKFLQTHRIVPIFEDESFKLYPPDKELENLIEKHGGDVYNHDKIDFIYVIPKDILVSMDQKTYDSLSYDGVYYVITPDELIERSKLIYKRDQSTKDIIKPVDFTKFSKFQKIEQRSEKRKFNNLIVGELLKTENLFPPEIFEIIISYLPLKDYLKTRLISKGFSGHSNDYFKNLSILAVNKHKWIQRSFNIEKIHWFLYYRENIYPLLKDREDIITNLKDRGIKFKKNEVNQMFQTQILFDTRLNHNLSIGSSKIGGSPDLPDSIEYPKNLNFAAQINISKDISKFQKFNLTSGILYFFCCEKNIHNSIDHGKVIYYDGDQSLLKPTSYPAKYVPFEAKPIEILSLNYTNFAKYSDRGFFEDLTRKITNNQWSEFLGTNYMKKGKEMVILFDILIEYHVYFLISKKNLMKKDFSKVIVENSFNLTDTEDYDY